MTSGVASWTTNLAIGSKAPGGAMPAGSSAPQPGGFERLLDSVVSQACGTAAASPPSSDPVSTAPDDAGAGSASPSSTTALSAGSGKSWSRKPLDQDDDDAPPVAPTASGDITALAQAVLLANTPSRLPVPSGAAEPENTIGTTGQDATASTLALAATGVAGMPTPSKGSSATLAAAPADASPIATDGSGPAPTDKAVVSTSLATAVLPFSGRDSESRNAGAGAGATEASPGSPPEPEQVSAQAGTASLPSSSAATADATATAVAAAAPVRNGPTTSDTTATSGSRFAAPVPPSGTAAVDNGGSVATSVQADALLPAGAAAVGMGNGTAATESVQPTSATASTPQRTAATPIMPGGASLAASATALDQTPTPVDTTATPASTAIPDGQTTPATATPVAQTVPIAQSTTPFSEAAPAAAGTAATSVASTQPASAPADGRQAGSEPNRAALVPGRPATARSAVSPSSTSLPAAPNVASPSADDPAASVTLSDENGSDANASSQDAGHSGAPHSNLDIETLDSAAPVVGPSPSGGAALALSASLQVTAALSRLVQGAGSAADASPGLSGVTGATPETALAGKVTTTADGGREIIVKLDPEHLGSVSIRLKMNGEKVDVSITVDNPNTLDLLNQDRHRLTTAVSALESGGPPVLSHGGSETSSEASGSVGGGSDRNASADRDPSADREPQAWASGDPAGAGQNRRGHQRPAASDAVAGADADAPGPISQPRVEGLYV